MTHYEVFNGGAEVFMAMIGKAADFPCHVFGHVVRPMLEGVEGNDPLRIIVLAGHQVFDGGL
jgi:hypothetical protein